MKTRNNIIKRFSGLLLCSVLLIFSCSKNGPGEDGPSEEKTQLTLKASLTEINVGEEVSFETTAGEQPLDADIYINDKKVEGNKYIFEKKGTYNVIAKKGGYKDSEKTLIKAFQIAVYVAGYEQESSISVAKYWKNDEAIQLSSGGQNAEAHSIFVANGDVYVAGHDGGKVKYWKNGTAIYTTDINGRRGTAYSIFVDNSDVYVAGWEYNENTIRVAKYWKNGISVPLTGGGAKGDAVALSVFVDNGDIYVAGYQYNGVRDVAKYWKNGTPASLTDGTNDAYLTSIFVENGNIHLAGYEYNGSFITGVSVAKYWKNRTPVSLSDGSKSVEARSVFVDNGDVFVTARGYYGYWKNGTPVPFSNETKGIINSIFVDNDNVYVTGIENKSSNNKVAYWKNGNSVLLSPGTKYAAGNSIFVARTLED